MAPTWLTKPLLIVSPHYDDAMLSAFSILGPGRRAANEVTVLTVFGGRPTPAMSGPWDLSCGFRNSDEAMTARAHEEVKAFAGLDVTRLALELIEDQYRTTAPSAVDTDRYVSVVGDWVQQTDGVVVAPAGAGGERSFIQRVRGHIPSYRFGLAGGAVPNPDHSWVTDVANARLPAGTHLVLNDDQPYNWIKGGQSRANLIAANCCESERPAPHHERVDVTEKARRASAYASQIPGILRSWVHDLAAALPSEETFWDLGPIRSSKPLKPSGQAA